MTISIILLTILLVICSIANIISKEDEILLRTASLIVIVFCTFVITIIAYEEDNIPAIEVYRNNTELKITGYYQDSIFIPTDTIIVLK